ncbi:MAG: hypothetical protein AAF989_17665 [Planctomycetota bacterium]
MMSPWYEYWIIMLSFAGAAEQAQQSENVMAAQRLREGMTQEEVLDVMGPPDIDYRPAWNQWCYGISVDIEGIVVSYGKLNPIPLRLRLISYAEDDVVVRWGVGEDVLTIDRPKRFDAPEEFHQMLDRIRFVDTVFRRLIVTRTEQGDAH